MSAAYRVNVRLLAEFAMEGGDLYREGMAIDRMQDGLRGHKALQNAYTDGFRSEVAVSLHTQVDGVELTVQGRIDGLNERTEIPIVEEIKTTRTLVTAISQDDYPVHWAQAYIYAHIIAKTRNVQCVSVKLTYHNLGGGTASFTRTKTAEQLETLFFEYARPYVDWLIRLEAWQNKSRPTMKALGFPYVGYRAGQREMAANAYIAFRDGKNLLCQAPTGIGKTSGALFPALKALGEKSISHIFYLTARTTARRAAEDALERMRAQGLITRSVTLTAREKICICPEARCGPEECPRARGYFDKRRDAMREALDMERLSREEIESLAEKYEVCPFELSLDLSETADIIICDYNYAFDPGVKLKRFFMDGGDYALLVDEAHNLADRARDFLSATLDQRAFSELRKEVGKHTGRKSPVYKTLSEFLKAFKQLREGYEEPGVLNEPPDELQALIEAFLEASREQIGLPLPYGKEFAERYFDALFYLRALKRYDEKYRTLMIPEGKALSVKIWCYDPSTYLRECMKSVKGCVLFSATLTPLAFYAATLGLSQPEGDAALSLPSPFPPENLCVIRINLATRYRQRERSADDVARVLLTMCRAKTGNYIACFPSHAYLNMVLERFLPMAEDIDVFRQHTTMNEEERAAFLANFLPNPQYTMLAMIAMGGVFAEGIDLPGDLLSGAAIVGVGIPQVGFERDTLRDLMNDSGRGYQYAYVYPGLERVLQAAGRVIRTDTDRGCVLLIDDRFGWGEYPTLLPPHWRVRPAMNIKAAEKILGGFWGEK